MRARLQSVQVTVGTALAVAMGAMLCVAVVLTLSLPLPAGLETHAAAFFTHRSAPTSPAVPLDRRALLVNAALLAVVLAYQIVATYLLNDLFKRTSAGEAFFLLSYVLSLSLEVLRLGAAAAAVRGLPVSLAVASTRLVYMGRIFGIASLFFSVLCSLGLRYSDYAVLSGVSLAVAVAMGTIVPVDSSTLTTGLVHAVSDGGGLLSASATGLAIVAFGAFVTPLVRQERKLLGYAAGAVCLPLGRELLSLGMAVPAVAGVALLVGGTYLATRSLERVYLGIS